MASLATLPQRPTPSTAGSKVLSEAAVGAWRSSLLYAALASPTKEMVLEEAFEQRVAPGALVHQANCPDALMLGLAISGLARVFSMSPTGRQVTVRYLRAGDSIGLPITLATGIVSGGSAPDGANLSIQALTEFHALRLSPIRFRNLVARDARNMFGLFTELARSLMDGQALLSRNVFLPIRARVARHMLDLAQRRDGQLWVQASQQDMADAIGSVRAVISRTIIGLRDDGLIRREDSAYIILEPQALHEVAIGQK